MTSRARLFKELKDAEKTKAETGIELLPDENNIYTWRALIKVSNPFLVSYSSNSLHPVCTE